MASSFTLTVRLFGKIDVERNGSRVDNLGGAKAQELLAYLLLHPGQRHSREALAELLWGESPGGPAKKYLRQALWQLQQVLEIPVDSPSQGRLLQVQPDWVWINADDNVWLDVAIFESMAGQIQGVPGVSLDGPAYRALQELIDLYRGVLLDGWYQDWCLVERERRQNQYLLMLDKATSYCEEHGDYEAGLAYGARILHYDRALERAHRRMMRLYYLSGNRTAALRQYACCVRALREDFGVRPARRTEVLHEEIRADRLTQRERPDSANHVGLAVAKTRVTSLLDGLRKIQALAADLQQQISHDIESLETFA